MGKVFLDWETAYNFVTDAFVGYGVPLEDAKICTDVLLESDKRGIESHGCNRFKPIYIDRIVDGIQNPITNYEILKETETTAVVDGHDGMGQVIGYKSMKMAIEKAKKYGMGMVVVRNSCHYGIAGYYATMATKEGCIGITGTNARPSVAPTFGVEGMFGTNPLTIGIPTDESFDFNVSDIFRFGEGDASMLDDDNESEDAFLNMNYKDYLRLLMLIDDNRKMNRNMASIIQKNMENVEETFDLNNMLYSFMTVNTFKSSHMLTEMLFLRPKDVELNDSYKIKIEAYSDYGNLK